MTEVNIDIPEAFDFLLQRHRYKSAYGGRGRGASWSFARVLSTVASFQKKRILCTREYQNSIKDSVHKVLSDQIDLLGLTNYFNINKTEITSRCGSEFIFKGLQHPLEIKSIEGIDIVWLEEAQNVSEESWRFLIPTIRKENSEIWLSWNTGVTSDPTYQRFVANPPEDCVSKLLTYRDNPFFPETLRKEMEYCRRVDPEAYDHIWEGNCLVLGEALIFRGKFEVKDFEAPHGTRFYYGADWGFSNDPTVLVRCYIQDNDLYIDHCVHGVGVELEEIPELFDAVPGSRDHVIRADSARPETISYIKRKGFAIVSCEKWNGCVQDGIAHMRMYNRIYIHPRCKAVLDEMQHYSYKKDKKTEEILPIVVDKFNHAIDSIRYALEERIKGEIDWIAVVNG